MQYDSWVWTFVLIVLKVEKMLTSPEQAELDEVKAMLFDLKEDFEETIRASSEAELVTSPSFISESHGSEASDGDVGPNTPSRRMTIGTKSLLEGIRESKEAARAKLERALELPEGANPNPNPNPNPNWNFRKGRLGRTLMPWTASSRNTST